MRGRDLTESDKLAALLEHVGSSSRELGLSGSRSSTTSAAAILRASYWLWISNLILSKSNSLTLIRRMFPDSSGLNVRDRDTPCELVLLVSVRCSSFIQGSEFLAGWNK
ncbi:hypothetical protein V2G26_017614 [Clonostachys chloroleuca]